MRWLIVFGALLAGCVGEMRPGVELLGLETDSYLLDDTMVIIETEGWDCSATVEQLRVDTRFCPVPPRDGVLWRVERSEGAVIARGSGELHEPGGCLGTEDVCVVYAYQ
jgi:hypothetical protein